MKTTFQTLRLFSSKVGFEPPTSGLKNMRKFYVKDILIKSLSPQLLRQLVAPAEVKWAADTARAEWPVQPL